MWTREILSRVGELERGAKKEVMRGLGRLEVLGRLE